MKVKRKQKVITLLLAAILLVSLVPVHISAATASWADDAVAVMNDIYGGGVFSANDAKVTVSEAKSLISNTLKYTGSDVNGILLSEIFMPTGNDGRTLTRKEACAMIYAILQLPGHSEEVFNDCKNLSSNLYKDAIGCMRYYGVVMEMPDGTFDPDGDLMEQFDKGFNGHYNIDLYMVNQDNEDQDNFIGGVSFAFGEEFDAESESGNILNNEPLSFESADDEVSNDENQINQFNYNGDLYSGMENSITSPAALAIAPYEAGNSNLYTGKEAIWNAWATRLNYCAHFLSLASDKNFGSYNDAPDDFLEAVIAIVNADRERFQDENRGLFSDVDASGWFYDGVMYMLNHSLVAGYGHGEFGPNDKLTRGAMSALIMRIVKPASFDVPTDEQIAEMFDDTESWEQHWFAESAYWAVANGYMTYADGRNFRLDDAMTREEMAYIAASKLYRDYDEASINLSALDRFTDKDSISDEHKPAMAYLVSAGVLGGTPEGTLIPKDEVSRGMGGVFLARVVDGLDKSWMKDYQDVVDYVLED